MSYRERFFGMLRSTLIGCGIGVAISAGLIIATGSFNKGDIMGFLLLGLILGAAIGIIMCAKSGSKGYMSSAVIKLLHSMRALFFSSLTGSMILLIIGIIRFMIGVLIMIPVGLYIVVSYFINFIYLGIMTLVEKLAKIDAQRPLFQNLDKLVSLISGIIVLVMCLHLVGAI